MAYFSNGTEGVGYMEAFCFKCKNWIDKKDGRGSGCPIWDLHLIYSYELCNSKSIGKKMLDFLIPADKHHCACKCSMFLSKKGCGIWINNEKGYCGKKYLGYGKISYCKECKNISQLEDDGGEK
jgi:hypothetical protein